MSTKPCTKCDIEKEVNKDNFHTDKLSPDGFRAECKMCRNAYRADFRKTHDVKCDQYDRSKDLKKKHKITLEQYSDKLEEQYGHCALCPKVRDGKRDLNVDHDHNCCSGNRSCGKCNRGLLCNECNQRVGYLEQLLKDFPEERRDQTEIHLRNHVAPDSWTHRALRYLKGYTNKARGATAC